MYVIIKKHREPDSAELITDHVIGPFATRADAEDYNQGYPSPEYNRIIRFCGPQA